MKVKLKNVLPNPFRDMDRYPIHPQKIEQLKKSVESTGFWDNIVAREAGNGKIEIAYGHHRLTALRELYDGNKEFDWIVRDLDDKEMLKIMAHENLDEWGHDSSIERETIRAVVQAFADNRIALAKPSGNNTTQIRYSPSFCFANQQVTSLAAESAAKIDRSHPYTADTINAFLGGTMSSRTIQYTLQALCMIERGFIKEEQLQGLSSSECRVVIEETERSAKQAEAIKKEAERKALSVDSPTLQKQIVKDANAKAKQIVTSTAKEVSTAIHKGQTQAQARQAATDARVKVRGETEKELPEINEAASKVAAQIQRLLDPDYQPAQKLEELIKFKKHLSPTSLQSLNRSLDILIEYAQGYKVQFKK